MRDLVVILSTFLANALLAFTLAWPVLRWAAGGQDWQGMVAIAWLIGCCVACGWLALRTLGRYRGWADRH